MRKRQVPYSPQRPSGYRHQVNGRAPPDAASRRRPYRRKLTAPKRRRGLKRLLSLLYDELRRGRSPS